MSPLTGTPGRLLARDIRRAVLLATLAMLATLAAAGLARELTDTERRARQFVVSEAAWLARHVQPGTDRPAPALSGYGEGAYGYRILGEHGEELALGNLALMRRVDRQLGSLPVGLGLWTGSLEPGGWPYIVGGAPAEVAGRPATVIVATLGDPENRSLWSALASAATGLGLPLLAAAGALLGLVLLEPPAGLAGLAAASSRARRHAELGEGPWQPPPDLPAEAAGLSEAVGMLDARLAAVRTQSGEMLGRLAHHLRTPLSVITLELGRLEAPAARRLEADVADLARTVARLGELGRLRSLGGLPRERLDLAELAGLAIEDAARLAARRHSAIRLECHRPAEASGEPASLRAALGELLGNALAHTPPGTRIRLACGPGAAIVVEDDGPGLADPSRLLEPLAQPPREGGHSGLGLAIAREAARLNGGQLTLERGGAGGLRATLHLAGPSEGGRP